jgi:hypothetical protein
MDKIIKKIRQIKTLEELDIFVLKPFVIYSEQQQIKILRTLENKKNKLELGTFKNKN